MNTPPPAELVVAMEMLQLASPATGIGARGTLTGLSTFPVKDFAVHFRPAVNAANEAKEATLCLY